MSHFFLRNYQLFLALKDNRRKELPVSTRP